MSCKQQTADSERLRMRRRSVAHEAPQKQSLASGSCGVWGPDDNHQACTTLCSCCRWHTFSQVPFRPSTIAGRPGCRANDSDASFILLSVMLCRASDPSPGAYKGPWVCSRQCEHMHRHLRQCPVYHLAVLASGNADLLGVQSCSVNAHQRHTHAQRQSQVLPSPACNTCDA